MASFVRLLVIEGIAFAIASLVHSGLLIDVSVDPSAQFFEGLIAVVLFAGAIAAWLRPGWTRWAASLAQGFGLIFSLIGTYLALIGVGPNTILDIVFHVAVVVALGVGLAAAIGTRPARSRGQPDR
jgi:hypothetical protein